ncbi:MAG: hypothetical protein F6K26_20115 [Moorea sp. SIO2I5]|nr:hypothetical protein [Moorena sp. SIO2I5]
MSYSQLSYPDFLGALSALRIKFATGRTAPDSLGALSALRIKFATGRTAPDSRFPTPD